MRTVQLPFFLSSAQGTRSEDGSRFQTRLSTPVDVPREAQHTRVFIQEASVVYSMQNVTSEENTFEVQLGHPTATKSTVFTLTIPTGLYDSVTEIMDAIAQAIIPNSLNLIFSITPLVFGRY